MGTFSVTVEVGSEDRQTFRSVEALVDTGSTFTWVPRETLEERGFEPTDCSPFEMADGSLVEKGTAEVPVRIDGKTRTTMCVFADNGGKALLGVVTLGQFLLAPDPIHKRLVPVVGLAMGAFNPS